MMIGMETEMKILEKDDRIKNHKITDQVVLKGIQQEEKGLFEIIVRRFIPYLYKIGRTYNFSHTDTLLLMEKSFVDAFKMLPGLQKQFEFKIWIMRIMMTNCSKKNTRHDFRREMPEIINNRLNMGQEGLLKSSEGTGLHRELGMIVEGALFRIPFEYRIIYTLREIVGLTSHETSQLVHISENNLKSRLSRARTLLKKEIEKSFSPGELFEWNLIHCNDLVEDVMKKINQL